jgi:hypothetical protein
MSNPTYTAIALIPAVAWLLYLQISQWRFKRFAHIPSKLSSNLLLGHLGHIAAEYKTLGSITIHPSRIQIQIPITHGHC